MAQGRAGGSLLRGRHRSGALSHVPPFRGRLRPSRRAAAALRLPGRGGGGGLRGLGDLHGRGGRVHAGPPPGGRDLRGPRAPVPRGSVENPPGSLRPLRKSGGDGALRTDGGRLRDRDPGGTHRKPGGFSLGRTALRLGPAPGTGFPPLEARAGGTEGRGGTVFREPLFPLFRTGGVPPETPLPDRTPHPRHDGLPRPPGIRVLRPDPSLSRLPLPRDGRDPRRREPGGRGKARLPRTGRPPLLRRLGLGTGRGTALLRRPVRQGHFPGGSGRGKKAAAPPLPERIRRGVRAGLGVPGEKDPRGRRGSALHPDGRGRHPASVRELRPSAPVRPRIRNRRPHRLDADALRLRLLLQDRLLFMRGIERT